MNNLDERIRKAIREEDARYLTAARDRDTRAMRRHRKAGNRVRGIFLASA